MNPQDHRSNYRDVLIDSFWDYLQGELDPAEATALEQALLADEQAAAVCKDLVETMVLAQEAFQSEGAALNELNHLTGPALLQELARREQLAQPQLVNLTEQSHASKGKPRDNADPLTLKQLTSAGTYLLHRYKAKAIAFGSLAAILVLSWSLYLVLVDQGETPGSTEVATTPREPDHIGPDTPAALPAVATLTASQNAQWAQGALAPGSSLKANQRLTLTEGFAEITTNRGAIAILQAPATIQLTDNDNALRLHTGKLVGICETESSKGFLVRTPHMDVTDLGTRFGVDATQSDATEVHVYEGEVEVSRPGADQPSQRMAQRLVQGQAVKSDATGVAFVTIEPAFDRFASGLNIHRLPGTGRGVDTRAGEDANWNVVAVNGQRLGTAVPLAAGLPLGRSQQTPNEPGVARWLRLQDTEQYQGDQEATYTIETSFDLPEGMDLDNAMLRMDFHADDRLVGLQFNGQAFDGWEQVHQTQSGKGTASIPLRDLLVKPGTNTVQFRVSNAAQTMLYLHVAWQIQDGPGANQTN